MTEPPPELARPVFADRVAAPGLTVTVAADSAECAAIARRLMVPSVQAVRCEWRLRPASGGSVEADGSLHARLHQECVVSLDEFPVELVEEFAVRFVPAGSESETADDPDEPDEIAIAAGIIELGEATVEQLALALDPYPRKPGAVLEMLDGEGPANPFHALAKPRQSE